MFEPSGGLRQADFRAALLLSGVRARVAGWSSPVARQAHNLKVVGSNPTPATIIKPLGQRLSGFFVSAALRWLFRSRHGVATAPFNRPKATLRT